MDSIFRAAPARIHQSDVIVMQRTTVDDIEHIRAIWPPFEQTVRLRGRKMYAMIDTELHTYTVCTPVLEDDRPDELSLQLGTLPEAGTCAAALSATRPRSTIGSVRGWRSWKQSRLVILSPTRGVLSPARSG